MQQAGSSYTQEFFGCGEVCRKSMAALQLCDSTCASQYHHPRPNGWLSLAEYPAAMVRRLPETIYVIQHGPDAGWNKVGIGDDREQSYACKKN
jgi:hypothetical protein